MLLAIEAGDLLDSVKCNIIAQEAWNTIITIAGQCGSGGHETGKELASRLGLELYDRKKLEEEAKKLGKLDISDAADIIINYINAKKISEQKHL